MKQKKIIILILIILFLSLTACDPMNLPEKPHPSGLSPCERYEKEFSGCSCDYSEGEAVLFRSGVRLENAYDAETMLGHYYFDNVALPNNLSAEYFKCKQKGEFFECYTEKGEYYSTVSDGDIFKVVCEDEE